MKNKFFISTNKNKLDINLIHDYLSNHSYWAKGRSRKAVVQSIEHSLCFGVYDEHNQQVGFARVLTDYAVLAWILDVFIIKAYQGRGLGTLLMKTIVEYKDLQRLQAWRLTTADAHDLYRKFGFEAISDPNFYMEIINKPS